MKRLKPSFPLLCFITTMMLGCSAIAQAANCVAIDSKVDNLNFGASLANNTLTIAADTPNGTVVYQDTVQSLSNVWSCKDTSLYGIFANPKLSPTTSGQKWFPLGKSGLSYSIWIGSLNRYEHGLTAIGPANAYGVGTGEVRLEIAKTGPLAEKVNIDAGYLGSLQGGELVLKNFNLMNPIVLNAASCQTPAVPVAMGDDYQLQDFDQAGATPRKVRFNIGLNQCQTGIKKVTYSLKATTPVIDAAKGIVALNNTSTATGIGLQLMNETGQPIALDTAYPFNAFTTTGTTFKIPLSAAYYRLPNGNLKAGSANTEVTFIVNYL